VVKRASKKGVKYEHLFFTRPFSSEEGADIILDSQFITNPFVLLSLILFNFFSYLYIDTNTFVVWKFVKSKVRCGNICLRI